MAFGSQARRRIFPIAFLFALTLALPVAAAAQGGQPLPDYVIERFGNPPPVPEGPLSEELQSAVNVAFVDSVTDSRWHDPQQEALSVIARSDDPRIAWLIADLMRFVTGPRMNAELATAAFILLGIDAPSGDHWGVVTDHLMAWDIPPPPDYLRVKRVIFTSLVPGWDRIFVEGDIDWRHVSWGGVLIDDREYDATDEPCNCIPAADNPEVSSAENATWLKDEDIVFGIEVNGEYRAYPRRIMEVREMVNDTLGGRHLGIPYCTLCGAAQAYFTDQLPGGIERPVLRTSGLLIRSNKVMYDVNTFSVFDTFKGNAVTGPLAEKNLQLQQASVVTTDWGTWKKWHPETTVLIEALALGRDFDFRNGRDADGPIFPVGDVDPRLPVHEDIIGVTTASGRPVAFQRSKALVALKNGEDVSFENVRLELEAGGIKAVDADGGDLGSHQAFWFAWSQFYPQTALWPSYDEGFFRDGMKAFEDGDYAEARHTWSEAAQQGHLGATTALADLLIRGLGGPVDKAGAVALYRVAAERGVATASRMVAELALGEPDDPMRNYVAAYVWFSIAARQGDEWSRRQVPIVRKKLSETEHAVGDRLIRKNVHLKF